MTTEQILVMLKDIKRFTSYSSENRSAANAVVSALIDALELEIKHEPR